MSSINEVSIAVLKVLIEAKSVRYAGVSLLLDKIEYGSEGKYKGCKESLEVEQLLLKDELDALNKSLNSAIDDFVRNKEIS